MVRRMFLLAVVITVWGCSPKHEAKTGEEFFEKFQSAVQAEDVETVWKMLTWRSQEKFVTDWKADKNLQAELTAELGENPDDLSSEDRDEKVQEWAVNCLRKGYDKSQVGLDADRSSFVKEEDERNLLIVVVQTEGKGEVRWVLVKERGFLKVDLRATALRNEKKP